MLQVRYAVKLYIPEVERFGLHQLEVDQPVDDIVLVLDMGSDPLVVSKHWPLVLTYSEGVEEGRVDLGKHVPPLLEAEPLPQVLMLAGQVVLEAGKVSIPGLLSGFFEHSNLVEFLELDSVK